LVSVCVLAVGGLLLAAREKAVKTAGALLLTALFLSALWLMRLYGTHSGRVFVEAALQEEGEFLGLYTIAVGVCVVAGWVAFFVGLRRQQRKEDELLSSVGQKQVPPEEPLQLDWRQQPPRGD
jgi:hypothetical protein